MCCFDFDAAGCVQISSNLSDQINVEVKVQYLPPKWSGVEV